MSFKGSCCNNVCLLIHTHNIFYEIYGFSQQALNTKIASSFFCNYNKWVKSLSQNSHYYSNHFWAVLTSKWSESLSQESLLFESFLNSVDIQLKWKFITGQSLLFVSFLNSVAIQVKWKFITEQSLLFV